jgi:hypothetical protein
MWPLDLLINLLQLLTRYASRTRSVTSTSKTLRPTLVMHREIISNRADTSDLFQWTHRSTHYVVQLLDRPQLPDSGPKIIVGLVEQIHSGHSGTLAALGLPVAMNDAQYSPMTRTSSSAVESVLGMRPSAYGISIPCPAVIDGGKPGTPAVK